MNRLAVTIGTLVAACVLFWCFPLFHVGPRATTLAEKQQAAFDAAEYVKKFWTAKLTPTLGQAADAATVLAALRDDPQQARADFGRSVGLGRAALYFARGSGKIVSVDDKAIGVSLAVEGSEADIAIQTGLLFGNTVRDATGLIHGDDFPNSQHFNEISTELNRVVETILIPPLKQQSKIGARIEFVGCAEVTNLPRDISPLKVIPLDVKFK
jgi:predicted lipoprotein